METNKEDEDEDSVEKYISGPKKYIKLYQFNHFLPWFIY